MIERRQKQQHSSQRIFTTDEVAEFAYCPLVWWHEQFEPATKAETDELFARMVELEHQHHEQAPALPEYQMIEQLLLRRGAFEQGHGQEIAQIEQEAEGIALAEPSEEPSHVPETHLASRRLILLTLALIIVGLLLIAFALVSMSSILLTPGLIFVLFPLAFLLILLNERYRQRRRLITEHRRTLGLPEGELVYEDVDGQGEILSSNIYPLVGKPHYIIRLADGRLVPVAVKTNVSETAPQPQHELQLAAYCLILEDYAELPPTYGILRYAESEFTIDYTIPLKKKVVRLLDEMERCTEQQPPPLKNQKAAKCRACMFQAICPVGRNK